MKKLMHTKNKHLFIIGAQRCGTTSILNYLKKYKIIISTKLEKPEPKYFLKKDINYNDYLNKFFKKSFIGKKILVDKSTSYIESNKAALNIKKYIKNPKILILLRNPVDRCISNYYLSKKNGYENFSLSKALKLEKGRAYDKAKTSTSPYKYLERGKYYKYLDMWNKLFKKKDIKIIILENLIKNKIKETKSLCNFLDIKFKKEIKIRKKNYLNYDNHFKYRKKLQIQYKKANSILLERYELDISGWQI